MLDVAEQAGLINPERRAQWESEWYVPFYRLSEMDGELSILSPSTKSGFSHQSAAIRRLKGSEVATNDLLENLLTNWLKLVDASVKNSALTKMVDQFEGTDLIENETLHYEKVLISNSQIAALIRKDRKALARVAELLGMPPDGMKLTGALSGLKGSLSEDP